MPIAKHIFLTGATGVLGCLDVAKILQKQTEWPLRFDANSDVTLLANLDALSRFINNRNVHARRWQAH